MASIEKRGDSYRVQVRKKGREFTHSFSNLETAELWGKYKDDLLNEMQAFNAPKSQMITLTDAIELKINRAKSDNLTHRSIVDLINLRNDFHELLDMTLFEITKEVLVNFCKNYLNSVVVVGGNRKENTGRKTNPSIQTMLSKLRRLSSVYGNLIENGINIENMAITVSNILNKGNRE